MKKLLTALCILFLLATALAEAWTCPGCGRESDGNFCPYCGTAKPPEEVTCPDCGSAYPADMGYAFCPNCGALLNPLKLDGVQAGDTVTFGRYEQDGDESNGPEDIEWIVLEVGLEGSEARAVLISKYGLAARPYNETKADVTWETCTLRAWLNGDFLNGAFYSAEQAQLQTVTVTADKNPSFDTDPGRDTQDRVYLLSINEANQYFASDADRICMPTPAAVADGAWTNDAGACPWWLRSPGSVQIYAARVDCDGGVGGNYVHVDVDVVRPVVVVRLS